MKNLLTISVVLLLIFLTACSDMGNNPVEPEAQRAEKGTTFEFIELGDLEAGSETSTEVYHWTGRLLWGPWGGNVPMFRLYFSQNGLVTVRANLEVPRNAFNGLKFISYLVDDELAVVDFAPGMEFDKDVTFNLKFTNIDLSSTETNGIVDFAYLDSNGEIVPSEYDSIVVDYESGTLEVTGAKIGHFSRYGFVRAIE